MYASADRAERRSEEPTREEKQDRSDWLEETNKHWPLSLTTHRGGPKGLALQRRPHPGSSDPVEDLRQRGHHNR